MIVRKIVVRYLAWSLRPGRRGREPLSKTEARDAIARAFPHRSYDWREQLLEEAQARNYKP